MLVLGIIAVLVGSAIYKLVGNLDVAKEQQVTADIQAISMQLRTYEMLNFRKPTTEQGLKALVQMPTTDPKPRKWKQLMETLPLDPWGAEYVYRNPGKKNPSGFDLYSLGPDGKESDDDSGKK
jgi:general secretion pathway protein G